jgi:hypothetical protein
MVLLALMPAALAARVCWKSAKMCCMCARVGVLVGYLPFQFGKANCSTTFDRIMQVSCKKECLIMPCWKGLLCATIELDVYCYVALTPGAPAAILDC